MEEYSDTLRFKMDDQRCANSDHSLMNHIIQALHDVYTHIYAGYPFVSVVVGLWLNEKALCEGILLFLRPFILFVFIHLFS